MPKRTAPTHGQTPSGIYQNVIEKLKSLKDPAGQTRMPSIFIKPPDKNDRKSQNRSNQGNRLVLASYEKLVNPIDLEKITKQTEQEDFTWSRFHELILQLTRQAQSIYPLNTDEYRNVIIIYHFFMTFVPPQISSSILPFEKPIRIIARKIWEQLRFTKVNENSTKDDRDEDDDDDEDDEDYLCDMFLELVDKLDYPDYYKIISNPIDLTMIGERIEKGLYDEGLIGMTKDIELLVSNCKTFNEPDSEVVATAEDLLKVYKKYLAGYSKDYLGTENLNVHDKQQSKMSTTKILSGGQIQGPNSGQAQSQDSQSSGSQSNSKFTSPTQSTTNTNSSFSLGVPMTNAGIIGQQAPNMPNMNKIIGNQQTMLPSKRKRQNTGDQLMITDDMDISDMLLKEDETGRITYPFMPAMADIYNAVIGYTVKGKAEGEAGFTIHGPFMSLPDKTEHPDYYKLIENPISLELIKERLEQQHYNQNIEHLCSDFMACFHNAKRYNENGSDIYIYATKLEGAVRRKKNDLYNRLANIAKVAIFGAFPEN